MQRILCRGFALIVTLAFGLTGCDGGGGDVGQGMPKDQGYTPIAAPPGAPDVSTDMTKIGNKSFGVKKAAKP